MLFASQVSAFTYVNPDTFKPWYKKWFERVVECKLSVSCYFEERLGAFTQLNSTDRQVDFPTTYNNNLNITMEQGTTSVDSITTLANLTSAASLATIGTITTGVWNGTTIAVAYGGTGSTTLSDFSVLLGSSTNAIGQVSGLGTSGQFLTSNGASDPPSWQSSSVNQTSEYDWTGDNTWTASTTFNTGTEAASSFFGTLFFEGVGTTTLDFSGTAANTASSSFMGTDASGAVSNIPYSYLLLATTTSSVSSNTSTTTLVSINIPAIGSGEAAVNVKLHFDYDTGSTGSGGDGLTLNLLLGGSLIASSTVSNNGNSDGVFEGELSLQMTQSGASVQAGSFSGVAWLTSGAGSQDQNSMVFASDDSAGDAAVSLATAQTLRLDVLEDDSDMVFTVRSGSAKLER